MNAQGAQVESLLSVLPQGARRAGTSKDAIGRIAVHYSSPAASLGQYSDPTKSPLVKNPALTLGLGALALIAVYRTLMNLAKRL